MALQQQRLVCSIAVCPRILTLHFLEARIREVLVTDVLALDAGLQSFVRKGQDVVCYQLR